MLLLYDYRIVDNMLLLLLMRPSIQVFTFYVKVLCDVFCSLIFLKAYPLGFLRMFSVTSIWPQNSVENILLLLLIQGQGHRLGNMCDVYVRVFCEVFLLFIFLTVSTFDC